MPLAAAAALVLDRIPDVLRGRRHPQRLLMALGDAWFAIGPAFVFVVAGLDGPQLSDWPLYLVALLAQFAGDYLSAALRERLGHGLSAVPPLKVMGEVWLADVLLSMAGLLAAFATVAQPYAYLLALPPAGLLAAFSRERRERIGNAIALSTAYRGTAILLGDVLSDEDEYTGLAQPRRRRLRAADRRRVGIDQEQRRLVELGAMLHDIGKLATPKEILNKPGPLTDDEWTIMRTHTIVGQRMLDQRRRRPARRRACRSLLP